MKGLQNDQFILSSIYTIEKKLKEHQNCSVYCLKSKETNKRFIAKHFLLNDPEEYLAYEALFGSLIDLITSNDVQGILDLEDYHTRNLTSNHFELILIYKQLPSSLREKMSILGKKVEIDLNTANRIFTELTSIISQLHQKTTLFLGLKPENIFFDEDGRLMITDVMFNSTALSGVHAKLRQEELERLENFPELIGKKEHNICIFDNGTDTLAKTVKVVKRSKLYDSSSIYDAPELINNRIIPVEYSDYNAASDMYSLGVS